CNHCNTGTPIEGRDNNLANHLMDVKQCPNAPASVRADARRTLMGKAVKTGNSVIVLDDAETADSVLALQIKRKSTVLSTLDNVMDFPLSEAQFARAHKKLFQYIVHTNIPFTSAENPYFHQFINELQPSYFPPSRYVLSHTIMDSEVM
ncbi:hypothetical protein C8J56DRAFT_788039, partial [Mycena floridula]